ALVEAHGILSTRGTSLKLLLAGTPDPENPTSISESELAIWNSRDGLEWLGHVNDVTALWAKSHIAVLPSRREGLPKSLLEAAALGRPIVASDAPGCREIAVDGMTALTHPIDDAKAIADALQRLRDNADLRKRYGAAARQLVVEHFSNDIIGSQTVELYNQLISSTSDLLARH
ncbi:MAG: glycosyltransferase, partial [Pseudomonadota bacterium]